MTDAIACTIILVISMPIGFLLILGVLCTFDNQWIRMGHKSFAPNLLCKIMGWHNGDSKSNMSFDGCSVHSQCSRCGKEVMQDSQGGWF